IEYCEAMNNGWDMPREGNGPVGIWAYMSDSITIQYCYAHHNKTSEKGKDGGGFDFDGGVRNSVMQYNLSAFNEGAGYGIFQYGGATEWSDNTMRYNVSYNDGSKNGNCGILVWCDPAGGPMHTFHAYGNTIVNSLAHAVAFEPGAYPGFLFENNVFILPERSGKRPGGTGTLAEFRNNSYLDLSSGISLDGFSGKLISD
ncbi:MAG: right-handed parallel beta-helix repeat-containing protein, partial [Bacteroidales bacterium]|nr:right-handed parallel beta-helix repeat-containing protein [Bacteroidales bacterium]